VTRVLLLRLLHEYELADQRYMIKVL